MPLASDEIIRIIETIETATEENKASSLRQGQLVYLPADGEVWIAGDIHDHRRNFEKFVAAADLGHNPQRHIVLHELIHGDHFDENMAEDSWRMLVQAAELKCDFSTQVHFLLANHDLAQIHGEGIMKGGLSVCDAFNRGIKRDFGDKRSAAHVAITEFLLSLPLAIRTQNGLFISHSIPTDDQVASFDYTVFDRELVGDDYKRRVGPVYQLIWGRRMSPATAAAFADRVGARLLITGHQPQESGYATNGDRMIIIASDHNQGVFLRLSLSEPYDIDGLVASASKFVALELPEADSLPELTNDFMEEEKSEDVAAEVIQPESAVAIPPVPEAPAAQTAPPAAPEPDPLPSLQQRDELCELLSNVLIDLRQLARDGQAAQAADLAEVFWRLPKEMTGQAEWSRSAILSRLRGYEESHAENPGQFYAAQFQRIVGG